MTHPPISPPRFPSTALFDRVCREGLSVVRPIGPLALDPGGWSFGTAKAPSHGACGRMRFLLALGDARALRPIRLLEVAAGDAGLSACLQQDGCEVVANDLRQENLESAVADFTNGREIRLMPGDIFALNPGDTGLFDLVTACEVIEHVAHPLEFLEKLRGFLTPHGRILLTTPNGAYFRNKVPTYSAIRDFTALERRQFKPDADGHLFLFTPREISEVAELASLRVDRLQIWGTPFISGESGARMLGPLMTPTISFWMERTSQHLPEPLLTRLANSMSVVLSKD